MSDIKQRSGGFTGRVAGDPMTRMRMAEAAFYEAQAEREAEAERQRRVAAFAESSRRYSIQMAVLRGENYDMRTVQRDGGVGHTPAEFIAYASALQDVQDAREAQRRAREGRHLTDEDWSAMHSADTSAPDTISDEAKRISAMEEGSIQRRVQRRRMREVATNVVHLERNGWLR